MTPAALTYENDVALLNAVYPGCVSTGGSTVISRAALSDLVRRHASQEDGLPRPFRSPDEEPSNGDDPEILPYWLDGRPLKTITLEALMAEAGIDSIDVLKLDAREVSSRF